MNRRAMGDKFGRDIDDVLQRANKLTETDQVPSDYDNVLETAAGLASIDFSSESRIKDELRQRLMDKIAARVDEREKVGFKETLMRVINGRRKPIFAFSGVVVALVCVQLIFPAAIPAAAQSISDFVEKVVLRRTIVTQIKPVSTDPNGPRIIVMKGGSPLDANDPDAQKKINEALQSIQVETYKTVDELRNAVKDRDLHVPSYIPSGYKFSSGMALPAGMVIMTYSKPGGTITIMERSASAESDKSNSQMQTSQPLRQAKVNGEPACWIEGVGLTWETADTNYTITAPGLKPNEVIKIAESIK